MHCALSSRAICTPKSRSSLPVLREFADATTRGPSQTAKTGGNQSIGWKISTPVIVKASQVYVISDALPPIEKEQLIQSFNSLSQKTERHRPGRAVVRGVA